MKQTELGFTLIELMITVAIVGILATIAYPSYQNSIMKSRRADAKSALLELANYMERHATQVGCYMDPGADNICDTGDDTFLILPFTAAPKTGTIYYDLALFPVTATSFTLTASPRAGSPQERDPCGILSLTNTGIKDIITAVSGMTAANCWQN